MRHRIDLSIEQVENGYVIQFQPGKVSQPTKTYVANTEDEMNALVSRLFTERLSPT